MLFRSDRAGRRAAVELAASGEVTTSSRTQLLVEFFGLMAGLLGAVVLLERLTGLSVLHLVPLAGLAVVAVVTLWRSGWAGWARLVRDYTRDGLPARYRELLIMQSAGFLAGSLRHSGIGDAGIARLLAWVPEASPWLAPLLGLIIIALGLVGFPPIPTTLIVAASVSPAVFTTAPAYFTIALLLGTGISFLLAPLSIPVVLLSSALDVGTMRLGARANWLFAVCAFVFGHVILWLLRTRVGWG